MLELTTGDTAPVLSGVCSNKDPVTKVVTPADLTGAAVAVHIKRADGTVLTKAATIVDADSGIWSTDWASDDLNASGTYKVEAQVTYGNAKIQTFGPAQINVKRQIA